MSDPLKRELPKLDGVHLTLGLGVLYLFGFIVANVHFGKYELPRIELLRARYLAAALLFVLCSAIPLAVGAFLSRTLRTRASGDGGMQPGLKLGETEAWAMGGLRFFLWLAFTLFLYHLLLARLTLRSFGEVGLGTLYFIVVVMVAWQFCDSYLGGEASEEAQAWPSIRMPQRVLYACLFILIVPAGFSSFLYGSMKPELGGGALWKARLTWRASADSSVRLIASGVVAIVDRDDHTVNVIACAQSGPPILVSVPAGDVSSIQLGELVSPTWFVSDYVSHCRPLDLTQKVAVVAGRDLLVIGLVTLVLGSLLLYWLVTSERKRLQSVRSGPPATPIR